MEDDNPLAMPVKQLYRPAPIETSEKENSGKIPQFAFQSPRKKIKRGSLLIDLHGGSLPCKFSFPFDQLSKGNSVNPTIIPNKVSLNCHEISISS